MLEDGSDDEAELQKFRALKKAASAISQHTFQSKGSLASTHKETPKEAAPVSKKSENIDTSTSIKQVDDEDEKLRIMLGFAQFGKTEGVKKNHKRNIRLCPSLS
eukprot:Colp12_sorted_trinity150504_noHs@14205